MKMLPGHRLLPLVVLALPILHGCGSSSRGSESGTVATVSIGGGNATPPVTPPKVGPTGPVAPGNDNKVSATASVDSISVAVGTSQNVVVTFTSNDGMPITAFSAYDSSGTLPKGWSAPSLTCATVAPGRGCVLVLNYAPVAVENHTLTLYCVYVDNAGLPRTPGPCMSFTYSATTANNVVASFSPVGEIDASIGGKQPLIVNFTTDDGAAATALTLTTSLGTLPSGWSSSATGLSCAAVSTGSGCQLPLLFSPTAAANGTLSLNYTYVDSSGAARTGTLNVPYATTSNEVVVASFSPTGQVTAVEKGGQQTVAVTFTTLDGKSASALSLSTNLTKLPVGWSSAATSFSCNSVSTGNGCQLQLSFTPKTLTAGTLTLRYSYNDANGIPNFGVLEIPYAATTSDNAVGTASPSGKISAMLGSPGQPVAVTFTTDDSRFGTAFQLTSSLTSLPAGWSSSANAFGCSAFSTGTSCQLVLTYAPTGMDNGTLTLSYAYLNNAGELKSGSVGIPYQTTTNDNVVGTANPTTVAAVTGTSNPVTVTFTTDDSNFASGLTADLSMLPLGWSSTPMSLSCASVSVGTACQASLTYAPTAAAAGTLSFGFNYVNSAGTTKSGTVSIPYTASP
ncbi:MAG: hypothetical protein M3O26_09305 [Pseudomonadota bacterium]|nr:hypothetical protein [Pseudomonadota bacterium]